MNPLGILGVTPALTGVAARGRMNQLRVLGVTWLYIPTLTLPSTVLSQVTLGYNLARVKEACGDLKVGRRSWSM